MLVKCWAGASHIFKLCRYPLRLEKERSVARPPGLQMRLDIFLFHDAKSAPVSISQRHGQHYVAYVMSQNRIRYCQQLFLAQRFLKEGKTIDSK
jgi:hypothetical protein